MTTATIYVLRLGDEVPVEVRGRLCPRRGPLVHSVTADGRSIGLSLGEWQEASEALARAAREASR